MVFPQGSYIAQTFIPKTPTILYSVTKGISKIYQLERVMYGFLKSFKFIKVQSYIHSYSFIL